MIRILDHPSLVFLVSLLAQWGAAYTGDVFRRWRPIGKNEREDFNTVLTATLTLLALIIGFSFSMAVSRYDQRKNYEEAEANAIGTECVRADLLPADDGTKLRELLRGRGSGSIRRNAGSITERFCHCGVREDRS
jgi:hypothetical protein